MLCRHPYVSMSGESAVETGRVKGSTARGRGPKGWPVAFRHHTGGGRRARRARRAAATRMDAAIAMNAMLAVALSAHVRHRRRPVPPLLRGPHRRGALPQRHRRRARAATRAAFAERGLDAVPVRGALSVTVPGAVGAWDAALERFGIALARPTCSPRRSTPPRTGVEIGDRLAGWIGGRARRACAPTRRRPARLLDAARAPLARRRDAAPAGAGRTLGACVARHGARDFYAGELAR